MSRHIVDVHATSGICVFFGSHQNRMECTCMHSMIYMQMCPDKSCCCESTHDAAATASPLPPLRSASLPPCVHVLRLGAGVAPASQHLAAMLIGSSAVAQYEQYGDGGLACAFLASRWVAAVGP